MRRGFTLVEILATIALAALLLLAGFRAVASLGRQRAMLARQEAARTYVPELADLLRLDLSNARYMKAAPNELTLTGYCGLDADTLDPNHRPVTVRYHLARAGGRGRVVREQTDLDVPTNRNRWSAVVCSGVAAFEVRASTADPSANADRPTGGSAGTRRDAPPAGVRVTRAYRTGWDGPELGLDQPFDQEDVPDRVRLTVRVEPPAAPAIADQWVYTR